MLGNQPLCETSAFSSHTVSHLTHDDASHGGIVGDLGRLHRTASGTPADRGYRGYRDCALGRRADALALERAFAFVRKEGGVPGYLSPMPGWSLHGSGDPAACGDDHVKIKVKTLGRTRLYVGEDAERTSQKYKKLVLDFWPVGGAAQRPGGLTAWWRV
jgi:hypothetical protein